MCQKLLELDGHNSVTTHSVWRTRYSHLFACPFFSSVHLQLTVYLQAAYDSHHGRVRKQSHNNLYFRLQLFGFGSRTDGDGDSAFAVSTSWRLPPKHADDTMTVR